MVNFLQLESKQREKLFLLITEPLMGCHWWTEESVAVGSYKALKMSLQLQEQEDTEFNSRLNIQQQEVMLIDGYVSHYLIIRKINEKWRILHDVRIFVQGLEYKLLKNILKVKNYVF